MILDSFETGKMNWIEYLRNSAGLKGLRVHCSSKQTKFVINSTIIIS